MISCGRIKEVIGPGGKIINEIIAQCDNVKIDIEQDGRVTIYHQDYAPLKQAAAMIADIVKVAKVGEIYMGKVKRIEAYGAFVELFPGCEGLLHVSEIAHERTTHPKDVFKMYDEVKVIVIGIDEKGKVKISRKELLPKPKKEVKSEEKN